MTKPTTDAIRFGTVGSPQTTPKPGTPAAIEHIRLLGMDHLEIAWVHSVRVSDSTCADIQATADQHHVTLSIHAPYYINLNSQTADLMRKSDERLLAAARKGFLAGARDIVFHPGSYHNQSPDQVYERMKEKLQEIRGILDEEGVDVILRPETMGKGAVFGSLDEVLQLSRDIPGVLPCIDFAHLHARTGAMNSYAEFAAIFDAVEASLGREGLESLHAHVSGIAYGPRGEKHHLPLNEADLRYRELLQALVDYNVRGSVAVEAPEPFHVADALTFQATYRRLLENQEPGKPGGNADES
ncbi:MAG: TIM barrel protein [Anaerolineae bacterium]|jgi:deoxyribonuclease-4|nr:TIM barrel protein [Anaerolineae bacterium]